MSTNHIQSTPGNEQAKQCQLLTPFQRKLLQKSLQEDLPSRYVLRLKIMLLADEGKSQSQICKALGCSQTTAQHWILMARLGHAHNWQDNPIGRPKTVNEQYLDRLRQLVSQSPRELGYPFQRWTAQWLGKHLAKELKIELSPRHINRLLQEMGLSIRQKLATGNDTTSQTNSGNSNIVIRDLPSSLSSESLSVWPFNFIR